MSAAATGRKSVIRLVAIQPIASGNISNMLQNPSSTTRCYAEPYCRRYAWPTCNRRPQPEIFWAEADRPFVNRAPIGTNRYASERARPSTILLTCLSIVDNSLEACWPAREARSSGSCMLMLPQYTRSAIRQPLGPLLRLRVLQSECGYCGAAKPTRATYSGKRNGRPTSEGRRAAITWGRPRASLQGPILHRGIMRELAGKTAFVTGGASGIGFALGRALAEAGMKVMLADIETDALAAAVKPPRF